MIGNKLGGYIVDEHHPVNDDVRVLAGSILMSVFHQCRRFNVAPVGTLEATTRHDMFTNEAIRIWYFVTDDEFEADEQGQPLVR